MILIQPSVVCSRVEFVPDVSIQLKNSIFSLCVIFCHLYFDLITDNHCGYINTKIYESTFVLAQWESIKQGLNGFEEQRDAKLQAKAEQQRQKQRERLQQRRLQQQQQQRSQNPPEQPQQPQQQQQPQNQQPQYPQANRVDPIREDQKEREVEEEVEEDEEEEEEDKEEQEESVETEEVLIGYPEDEDLDSMEIED